MATVLTTIQEQAYNKILERIISGELLPETQLVNRKLAAELGVSSTPVREALNRLAKEGIIENHSRWGYFTKKFSPADIVMILEVRENIETLAARLAAGRITTPEISTLKKACKEHGEVLDQGDKALISKDQCLHNAIARISGNNYLERIVSDCHLLFVISWCVHQTHNQMHDKMGEAGFHKFLKDRHVKAVREHEDIVNAISNHNEQEAEKFMRIHIADLKTHWAKFPEEEG